MKIKLSSSEMLAQWKLRRGFEPLRADCVISRADGIDLDALHRLEMRDWYLNLLNTAPVEMLVLTDIASDITVIPTEDGVGTVLLPESCHRLVEFQLNGWSRPATIIEPPDCYEAQMQINPYSRGGVAQPVVVKRANRLHLYSLPPGTPSILRAMAVVEPADGTFEMDESALATINA